MNEMVLDEVTIFPEMPQQENEAEVIEENPERNELAAKWKRRIEFARKFWSKYHKRCRYNRKIVKNVSDDADPGSDAFNVKRANLIQGTISALVPVVYARAPEISVIPKCPHDHQTLYLSPQYTYLVHIHLLLDKLDPPCKYNLEESYPY